MNADRAFALFVEGAQLAVQLAQHGIGLLDVGHALLDHALDLGVWGQVATITLSPILCFAIALYQTSQTTSFSTPAVNSRNGGYSGIDVATAPRSARSRVPIT